MRLLYLNRSVVLAGVVVSVSTACGGDFRISSGHQDSGVSDTGGVKGAGGSSADSGSSSGGADTGGAGSGGSGGHGARGGTTASGGADAGGSSNGGADAGSDGGAATGGSGSGGTSGNGNGGTGNGGRGGAGGASGAGAHPQFVKDYDRKCTYDSACSLVYQGNDVCSCDAQCPNASIANTALSKWDADRQAMQCVALPCAKLNCQSLVASCGSSQCYARKPLIIDATHYDQGCLTTADCTTIPTGEVCSPCQCSRGAVSNKGYQDYLKDKQNVQCSPGPVACDCAPQPTTVSCVLSISGSGVGKCTLTVAATTN